MNSNIVYDSDRIRKLASLQDTLLSIAVGVSTPVAVVFLTILIIAHKQNTDSKNASIKEGNILRTEIITKNSKAILKNVVIDTNNNGIEDMDDVVIDGNLFTFSEANKGRNVVYLQEKKKAKPLAIENKNGRFDIKKTPSDVYNLIEVENLDNEFNNIMAQKSR